MIQELTKETAKKLMEIKGEARGAHLQNDADFILKEKGEQGLKKVEEELAEVGYPIKYKKINTFDFYPIGIRPLSLLAIKKAFDWPDEKIEELGAYAMKVSWIIRIFMKYFFSIEKILQEAQQTWSKYFNVGQLIVESSNLEKKEILLKVKDFDLHPIFCHCLKGVFLGITRMAIKPKEISCEETECSFDNGKEKEHHFLIKWK